MDKQVNQYLKQLSLLSGVSCSIFKDDEIGNQFCLSCPENGQFKNTHNYGFYEAHRWSGRYIYYCSRGLIFIAISLEDNIKVLLGPIAMGDPEGHDYPDYIPKMTTAQVNALCEVACGIFRTGLDTVNEDKKADNIDYPLQFGNVKHADIMYKVTNYIKQNYNKKITLDDIAGHVYLSKQYLSKIFKKEMDCTITTYINCIRVEKSKALLNDSELTLYDIASMVGFDDQSYFTKIFKNVTGVAPGKYRNNKWLLRY